MIKFNGLNKHSIVAIALIVFGVFCAQAEEGMWTLDNPPLKKMQNDIGWKPSSEWIGKAMRGSARIAGGCSASFISKDGLVLTNHHCISLCAQELSTPQKNYLEQGFLAESRDKERICPAMEINRLEQISDVTEKIKAATQNLSGATFKLAQNATKAKLTSECAEKDRERVRCDVVSLYQGGQYKLYKYRRFQDVRLVFAPELAIAFFGGDPDNFNFPRYDFDMSLIRVYENDKPLQLTSEDYFKVSLKGPSESDPVFILGNPGSTQRGLTVAQLLSVRENLAVNILPMLSEYRGLLTHYQSNGAEPKRVSTRALFRVENSYKVIHGQLQALLDGSLIKQKEIEENRLKKYVASSPTLTKEVGTAWQDIEIAQLKSDAMLVRLGQVERSQAFESEYYKMARILVRGAYELAKPNPERLPEYNDSALPQLEAQLFSQAPIYPDFEKLKLNFSLTKMRELLGADDSFVALVLAKSSPKELATSWVDNTKLDKIVERKRLWSGGVAAILESQDPFIQLALKVDPVARSLRLKYEGEIESVITKATEKIAKAKFQMNGDRLYPDATFTFRMSYGLVKGWKEGEKEVSPFTKLGGAYDRATGFDPFKLPPSWLNAKEKLNLDKKFNFSSTNDIIGGNSGSPVLNTKAELVGLVFDGNIHSLGGSFWFNEKLNRAISVDSSAFVEVLDKVYGAEHLVKEITAQ